MTAGWRLSSVQGREIGRVRSDKITGAVARQPLVTQLHHCSALGEVVTTQ